MANPISSHFLATIGKFEYVLSIMRMARTRVPPEPFDVTQWEDELGRLRLWGADFGLHGDDQTSLDVTLRDATHISNQIIKLFQELDDTMDDVVDVLIRDSSLDTERLQDEISEYGEFRSQIQQLQECVVTTIGCLFQMSILSRKPARHDFLLAQESQMRFGQSDSIEELDRAVELAFFAAETTLIKRMAFAMTQGLQSLDYRSRLDTSSMPGTRAHSVRPEVLEEFSQKTSVSELLPGDSAFSDSSDSGSDQPASVVLNVLVPTLDERSSHQQYKGCPYCSATVDVRRKRSWRRHLLGHLRPYICVNVRCPSPYSFFSRPDEWRNHMRDTHAKDWTCSQGNHDYNPEEHQDHSSTCPICVKTDKCGKSYEKHVASHLEHLALKTWKRSNSSSWLSRDVKLCVIILFRVHTDCTLMQIRRQASPSRP